MADVQIEYCVECMYLERALEVTEALLNDFPERIEGLTLVPGTRGVFTVSLDGEPVSEIEPGELPPAVADVHAKVANGLA
ncbi:MAG: SelT/SelW/SelH family protein [Candidatus Bipolaricaulia bacterium]